MPKNGVYFYPILSVREKVEFLPYPYHTQEWLKVPAAFKNVSISYRSVKKRLSILDFSFISVGTRFSQKFWKKISWVLAF